jgi:hypothetical protein
MKTPTPFEKGTNRPVVGEPVEVNFNGSWYAGTVARVVRTRIEVTFTTGSGRTRTKPFQLAGDRWRRPTQDGGRDAS